MKLIDTHAHLYADRFDEDRAAMVARAFEQGVAEVYLPNIDLNSIEGMLALEQAYPGRMHPMMGLHPCSVQEGYREVLAQMHEWLDRRDFVAIGEIGMDLYWDTSTQAIQEEAFRMQIGWAKERELPIVIHMRNATEETLRIVEEEKDDRLRGIFHCFTGTVAEAERILALEGFYLGIGGILTFEKAGLDKVVAELPLGRMVLETDAPYLAPTPYRGKRNESAYVRQVAERLAAIKGVTLDTIATATTANARGIFHSKAIKNVD